MKFSYLSAEKISCSAEEHEKKFYNLGARQAFLFKKIGYIW